MRNQAVVLTAVNTGTRHHTEVIHPTEWNDLLQAVHHDINENDGIRNMPVARQERAFRLRAAAREFTVAIGADYTRILCRLTFAADNSAAAPTLGVADTVGVVGADRGTLPVACVVGKVLH